MRYNNFDYWQKNVAALGFPVQTKEDIDRAIVALYRRERSLLKVGRLLGVSAGIIDDHLRSLGEPKGPRGGANNTKPGDRLLITYNGKTQYLRHWARELGFRYTTLYNRVIRAEWGLKEAFFAPLHTKGKVKKWQKK